MKVIKIEAFYNDKYNLLIKNGDAYTLDDIKVKLTETGEVKITATKPNSVL